MIDPAAARDRGKARRAAAWRHHPDRGGSAEALIATLAAIDHRCAAEQPVLIIRRSRRARLHRRMHLWRRRRRSRRYIIL